jgi:hypothetical protein
MAGNKKYFSRGMVSLLEDLETDDDVNGLIRSSIGSDRFPRHGSDYRRPRSEEDGYGELDFA